MSTLDLRDIDMTYPDATYGSFKMSSPNTVVDQQGVYQIYDSSAYQHSISFHSSGEEVLRCGPEGFYVRGKKVEQDDNEAKIVYNSFKEWLTWSQLNRG